MTSFASLGFVAQFFSVIFIKPKGAVKKMVTVMHFVNQLMFVVLYLTPYISIPSHIKAIIFAIMYLGGMVFSFLMGCMIDHFKAIGNEEIGFFLSGITIFVLCVLHLVSLVVVKDPEDHSLPEQQAHQHTVKSILGIPVFDKKMSKVILLDVMWHIATGISTAYFAIYAQKSMGIAVVTITVITAAY